MEALAAREAVPPVAEKSIVHEIPRIMISEAVSSLSWRACTLRCQNREPMIAAKPVTSKGGYHIAGDIQKAADAPGQEGLKQFIACRDRKENGKCHTGRHWRESDAACAEERGMRHLRRRHGTREHRSDKPGSPDGNPRCQCPARQRTLITDVPAN